MASDDKPKYPEILELPPNLTPAQFQTLVNDRIRDLNILLRGVAYNPALTDLAMANFRITGLADPTDDLDAVNLRTLRRQGVPATQQQAVAATTASGTGAYTIVSESNGPLNDGDIALAYVVGLDRVGTPEEVWLYSETPPTTDCAINWQVQISGGGPFANLLSADLVLPGGHNGPVFSTAFALHGPFPRATVIKVVATTGGQATKASMGLTIKKSA